METWERRARECVDNDARLRRFMHLIVVTRWGGCRHRAAAAFARFAEMGDEQ